MKRIFLSLISFAFAGFAESQHVFPELVVNFYDQASQSQDPDAIVVPASPIKYDVLFIGGTDEVVNADGTKALAKEWQDFTGYLPINGRSDSGYVIVNHEQMVSDKVNGDGGGMTVFTVYFNQSLQKWTVIDDAKGKFRNVDFSSVGGTGANCGGIQTSWGQVFTAEEWGDAFSSNSIISAQGIADTSDFTVTSFNGSTVNETIPRYKNYQYMVEVDVQACKAIRKNYNMGRYDHEGGWIASDRKTVYLSDDYSGGAVLFKFVADKPEDFSKGQLYCYKQSADGKSGSWVALNMDLNTMLNARKEAWKLGATCFMRLEWVEGINDDIVFITETGRGKSQSVKSALLAGGQLANHLVQLDVADGKLDSTFTDMYGRVLRLNTKTGVVESAIEGGGPLAVDYVPTKNHLSSPDGLASIAMEGRVFLAINEDMNPNGMPANPRHFSNVMNEIYILDVTGDEQGKKYSVDELRRFAVGPKGCETTGGRFTPDGSTYFVNIQHPSTSNPAPFNHSVTLAISGYRTIFNQSYMSETASSESVLDQGTLGIYPNPASREIHLSKEIDFALYNNSGQRMIVQRKANRLDISDLSQGIYFLVTETGESHKLVIE